MRLGADARLLLCQLLEALAALEAEAETRSTEENLKWQITRKRERIKMLQERVCNALITICSPAARRHLAEHCSGRTL